MALQDLASSSPVRDRNPGSGPPTRTPFELILLFLLLASAISLVYWRFHVGQSQAVEAEVRRQLLAISDLRVRQLADWRDAQFGEAHTILADPVKLAALREYVVGRRSAAARAALSQWMEAFRQEMQYAGVNLTDGKGDVVLSVGRKFGGDGHLRELTEAVLRNDAIVLRDFSAEAGGPIHLGLNFGLRITPGAAPFGALLVSIDPRDYLYPLLSLPPVASKSAETVLVRRNGDEVIYLNALRHRRDSPLNLRIPLTRRDVPSVQAASGVEGAVDGLDYRGVPVYAAARRVPNSDWIIVTKVDVDEVLAPLIQESRVLGGMALSLIVAAGICVVLLWRRQQLSFFRARYEAEQERRALLGHYDYLTRFANDVVLLLDSGDRIIEANDRAVSTYGYSREELLTMCGSDLRKPEQRDCYVKLREQVLATGSLVIEGLHLRKDGTTLPVEVSSRSIDVDGSVFVQSIVRDISERKAITEELRQTAELMRAVIDASPVGILSLQPDFTVVTWNKAAELIFGLSAEEVLGRQLDPAIPREMYSRALAGDPLTRQTVRIERKDGEEIVLSLSAALVRGKDGQVTSLVASILDITLRQRAEEALAASERRFRGTFEQAAVGMNHVGLDGRFLRVNRRFCEVAGYSEEELCRMSWRDLTHPDDRAQTHLLAERLLSGASQTESTQRRNLRKDGSVVWVWLTISVLRSPAGQPLHFIGVVEDITERKRAETERARLEQQLLQAQKMESVGRLAGGVAHDFNNLLTVINGYTGMLLQRCPPEDSAHGELLEIQAAGERAASLTQQLLAFSRKQIAAPKPTDLNGVVQEGAKMLRRLIGEDTRIVTQLDPSIGPVMTDAGQMHQVLMNLTVNAKDAMPEGGLLTISTQAVTLGAGQPGPAQATPGRYVCLAVQDTGTGMDEETRQKVFEPFFTTKPVGSGTGLGLSTVYGIVSGSGGWINVASQPKSGTTFSIYLPVAEPVVETVAPAVSRPVALGGSETVLLVEDQADLLKLAAGVLRKQGYQVLEAASGEEALVRASQFGGTIHLLLTDVVMSGMQGPELARRLGEIRPATRVLFISGYTAEAFPVDQVLRADLDLLAKPFTPIELCTRVRTVLGAPVVRKKILVIDDEEPVRRMLRWCLERSGYAVREAINGRTGLGLVKAEGLDLVITDLLMPEQEGIETIRILRSQFPDLPVIAISGAMDGQFLKAAAMLGARGTLRKPIEPDDLLAEVRRLLRIEAAPPPC